MCMQLKISIEYILADMSIHSSKYKTCSCFMFETNQMCMLLTRLQIVAVVYVVSLDLFESVAGCGCGCADRSSIYKCTYLSAGRSLHMIFIHIFATRS